MLDLRDGDPRYYCYNKAEIMNVPLHQAKNWIAEKHIIKKNKDDTLGLWKNFTWQQDRSSVLLDPDQECQD